MRTEYSIFVGKPEVNGQLGDLGIGGKLIIWTGGRECVGWIWEAQVRAHWRAAVNTLINLRVPWKEGNFLTSGESISFSKKIKESRPCMKLDLIFHILIIKRIVFLDFIHRLVSQEQTKLRKLKIIDKNHLVFFWLLVFRGVCGVRVPWFLCSSYVS
jgi:hypothetical protein